MHNSLVFCCTLNLPADHVHNIKAQQHSTEKRLKHKRKQQVKNINNATVTFSLNESIQYDAICFAVLKKSQVTNDQSLAAVDSPVP